jgi:hypothetical protein
VLLAVVLGTSVLAGCRPDTVTLGFEPDEGATYRYRYEIDLHLEQALEGEEPEVTEVDAVVTATFTILEQTDAGPRARLTLRRDGGGDHQLVVLLDRAGTLRAVQEIAGLPTETFGLDQVSALLGLAVALPPTEPVALGDTWSFGGDLPIPRPVTGTATLERFGVIDGAKVAEVRAELRQALDEDVAAGPGGAHLTGEVRSDGTTSYDIGDGAVRRSSTTAAAEVEAVIQPPPGTDAAPALAAISYVLEVSATRLD